MQYEVSSHSLALRELQHLGEQLDLLLVSADLAIGAGETYTAQIAINLSHKLRQLLNNIEVGGALPYAQEQFVLLRLTELLSELEQQFQSQNQVTARQHDEDRSALLAQFDATSAEIVMLFEQLFAAVQAYSAQKK